MNQNSQTTYDVNDVAEYIFEFAKAKDGVSNGWQDDVDGAVRKLFPGIANDQVEEAVELAECQYIAYVLRDR